MFRYGSQEIKDIRKIAHERKIVVNNREQKSNLR